MHPLYVQCVLTNVCNFININTTKIENISIISKVPCAPFSWFPLFTQDSCNCDLLSVSTVLSFLKFRIVSGAGQAGVSQLQLLSPIDYKWNLWIEFKSNYLRTLKSKQWQIGYRNKNLNDDMYVKEVWFVFSPPTFSPSFYRRAGQILEVYHRHK